MLSLIDNGISLDEPYYLRAGANRSLLWLPSDSPYGNFQLKLVKIEQLTYVANLRLKESFDNWKKISSSAMSSPDQLMQHIHANEQAIYLIRRAADEIIALVWCLSEWVNNGNYPSEIEMDCIGQALKTLDQKIDCELALFLGNHQEFLRVLNPISNAFKHSFMQSDIMALIGRDEPCVHTLELSYNKLQAVPKLHAVPLAKLVKDFSAFYNAALEWLGDFSRRYCPTAKC